jgi:hypothetical protein
LFLAKDKEKIVGYRVCDCHDLLSASLAMTEEERVTSYEIIILAFTRFTMIKKEKITHQAEHTAHSPLWTFFLSLGVSPPLDYGRNTIVFVNTSSSPCHCEE